MLEPKLVRDIQVFIDFINFYWQFIRRFSNIATPLALMMKTTFDKATNVINNKSGIIDNGGDSADTNSKNLQKAKTNKKSAIS